MSLDLQGRVIRAGRATGEALVSTEPVSFYGGVDLDTGRVAESGHPLEGQSLAGRVLVIPRGKGSTVGSWAILRLGRKGLGPAAILCERCETIVAVGVILAEIPCVDGLDITQIQTGQTVTVDGDRVQVTAIA
jgi:phosphomecalonate degydratase small subunit